MTRSLRKGTRDEANLARLVNRPLSFLGADRQSSEDNLGNGQSRRKRAAQRLFRQIAKKA